MTVSRTRAPTPRKRYTYAFPRPLLTVDTVIFTVRTRRLEVLLVKRKNAPFAGRWALPGGFVEIEEPLEIAALRELKEETGLKGIPLYQFGVFGDPGRDPRGRSITVAYLALVNERRHTPIAADDAAEVGWFGVAALPESAFDHAEIIRCALTVLRTQLNLIPVGLHVLPRMFTVGALRELHEILLGKCLDPQKHGRRLIASGLIRPAPSKVVRRHRRYCFTRKGI